ncbi:hypothetical protein ACFXI8_27035 [Streptomyces niveus]|uniref:hypothetical protein n=1 Tax=Streptomyces niveus TaxID=193462 RepID=UPI00368E37E1
MLIETYAARLERVNSFIALMDPALGLLLADCLDAEAAHRRAVDVGQPMPGREHALERGPADQRGRIMTATIAYFVLPLLPRAENDGLALPWFSGRTKS